MLHAAEKSEVIEYEFEGRIKRYIPDFKLCYNDGKVKIIEIKPRWEVETKKVKLKILALEKYCRERDYEYEIWTEKGDFDLLCFRRVGL